MVGEADPLALALLGVLVCLDVFIAVVAAAIYDTEKDRRNGNS